MVLGSDDVGVVCIYGNRSPELDADVGDRSFCELLDEQSISGMTY
jgi:hypothetical protein